MSEPPEDAVARVREAFLDPFFPAFPMPGMWHLAFGFGACLMALGAGLVFVPNRDALSPAYQFAIAAGAALVCTALLILCIRGIKAALHSMRTIATLPWAVLLMCWWTHSSTAFPLFFACAAGAVAFWLLSATATRALVNVMAIRNAKIAEMKRDGTYQQKREEGRRRWLSGLQ